MVPNSAGCERNFSDFGITHTKLRNRLGVQKVHKTAIVKADRRRVHTEAGLRKKQHRRQFGSEFDISPAAESTTDAVLNSLVDNSEGQDVDFLDVVGQFMTDARELDNDDDDDDEFLSQPILTNPNTPIPHYPTRLPLKTLFRYPENETDETDLAFYWKGGIKNLEEELKAYDILEAELGHTDTVSE